MSETLNPTNFMIEPIKKGKERMEMERRERSEEVYSFFLSGMEDL